MAAPPPAPVPVIAPVPAPVDTPLPAPEPRRPRSSSKRRSPSPSKRNPSPSRTTSPSSSHRGGARARRQRNPSPSRTTSPSSSPKPRPTSRAWSRSRPRWRRSQPATEDAPPVQPGVDRDDADALAVAVAASAAAGARAVSGARSPRLWPRRHAGAPRRAQAEERKANAQRAALAARVLAITIPVAAFAVAFILGAGSRPHDPPPAQLATGSAQHGSATVASMATVPAPAKLTVHRHPAKKTKSQARPQGRDGHPQHRRVATRRSARRRPRRLRRRSHALDGDHHPGSGGSSSVTTTNGTGTVQRQRLSPGPVSGWCTRAGAAGCTPRPGLSPLTPPPPGAPVRRHVLLGRRPRQGLVGARVLVQRGHQRLVGRAHLADADVAGRRCRLGVGRGQRGRRSRARADLARAQPGPAERRTSLSWPRIRLSSSAYPGSTLIERTSPVGELDRGEDALAVAGEASGELSAPSTPR